MNIENKTVLITGANRGIGRALVNEALRRGAKRVYAGTRGALQDADKRVMPLTLDVTNISQIQRAADEVESLDLLINNAGIAIYDDLSNLEVLEQHLAVNFLGMLKVTHAFLPLLRRSKGAIVNNLSLVGLAALPVIPSYSMGVIDMTQLRKLEEQIAAWPHVSVHPHRFGGREFRFGNAELGHVHLGGIVDIPFPRAVRDALLADGLAEQHHWVPNSGWTTFHVRGEGDPEHALWLMRLSYLRYALKTASDPSGMLKRESEELGLSPHLRSLLQQHLPTKAERITADLLTA